MLKKSLWKTKLQWHSIEVPAHTSCEDMEHLSCLVNCLSIKKECIAIHWNTWWKTKDSPRKVWKILKTFSGAKMHQIWENSLKSTKSHWHSGAAVCVQNSKRGNFASIFSVSNEHMLQDWEYKLSKNNSPVQAGWLLLFSAPLKIVEGCCKCRDSAMRPPVKVFFFVCVCK